MPKALSPIIRIAKYTIADEVRQKSFLVLFALCALFVFLIRGCFQGNYMINGEVVDGQTVVLTVSKVTFHLIAAGVTLITALLAMRSFRRDRQDGVQSCILSKPVARWQYVAGKVAGLWAVSTLFLFTLHGIIFLITAIGLKIVLPEYLAASLLCSLNLLFVVLAVLLFSLAMPDIAAFLLMLGTGIASFVADGIYAVSRSPMAHMMMQPGASHDQGLTAWKVIYILWPKLSGTQRLASSLIGDETLQGFAAVYPLVNIVAYCLVLICLLLWRFRKEDIT